MFYIVCRDSVLVIFHNHSYFAIPLPWGISESERNAPMSTSTTLKLALELAAKVTGREDLAALAG